MTCEGRIFGEMREFKSWTDYYRTKNGTMTSTVLTNYSGFNWTEQPIQHNSPAASPTRTRRLFSTHNPKPPSSPKISHSPKLNPKHSPTFGLCFEDTTSSEDEPKLQKEEEKKARSGSIISFSNVKRKLSTKFNRRNSHAGLESPKPIRKDLLIVRRASSNSLLRQSSLTEIGSPKVQPKVRRSSTIAHDIGVSKTIKLVSDKHHPLLDRLRNNIMQMDPFATSSTPNIQSRSRSNSTHPLKQFKVFVLGSRACGKTALTVRFLTGRYIGEYKSTPEEVYSRVVKYGDEQADVTVYANDVENMEEDINLDQNSGIMILYSIIDKTSYEKAKIILEYLKDLEITGKFPVVLVGTKRDLSHHRKVKRQHAFNIANEFNCTHYDVSAATDRKVKDSFHTLFRQIEIRQLLHHEDSENTLQTILNPPKMMRHGTYRYGTC